jgi:hypothetical protein
MWRSIRSAMWSVGQLPAQKRARAGMSGQSVGSLAWDVEGLESRQLLTADLAAIACGFCQTAAQPQDDPLAGEPWSPAPELMADGGAAGWDVANPFSGPLLVQSLELPSLYETLEQPQVDVESPQMAALAAPAASSASKLDATVLTERGVISTRPGLAPLHLIPDRPVEDTLDWTPGAASDQRLEPIEEISGAFDHTADDGHPQAIAAINGRLEQLAGRGRLASSLQPVTQSPLTEIQNTLGWLTDEEYRRLIGGEGHGRLDDFEPTTAEPSPDPSHSPTAQLPIGQAWPASVSETPVLSQSFNLRLGIRNWLSSWSR